MYWRDLFGLNKGEAGHYGTTAFIILLNNYNNSNVYKNIRYIYNA